MLTATALSHEYNAGTPVLRDISFQFAGPGILALVGASGSGKTTLLSILGRATRPTSGTFEFAEPLAGTNPTWLFQTPNVMMHRTVQDNVALGAMGTTQTWAEARHATTDILVRYGLGHRVTAKARTLSGGETQRMVLARAEMAGSKLLLADEPTGQLDHHNTALVVDALRKLAEAGGTVIVATHDPAVANAADAVLSITNGEATYVDHQQAHV